MVEEYFSLSAASIVDERGERGGDDRPAEEQLAPVNDLM
jgi:hypothetical protein